MVDWITRYCSDRIQGEVRRLSNCEAMIPALAEARLSAARALLDREMTRIPVLVGSRLAAESGKIDSTGRIIGTLVCGTITRNSQQHDNVSERQKMATDSILNLAKTRLESLSGMVEVLSPSNTLRRGYSITRINGKAVTEAGKLKKGERIVTLLYDGSVESEVL